MERLDLGLPKEGSFWRGALIGAAAVGAGSALLGLVTCSEETCAFGDMTTGQAVLLMGGIGATIGFVAGGLVGARSGGMQWEEVSIEGLRIQADADGAGLAIFVPLRF